jgi:hypothetical protein
MMMKKTTAFIALSFGLFLSPALRAQENSDDFEKNFGASSPPSASDEFEKGFGASSGISESEKSSADEDRLKIGGNLQLDAYGIAANDEQYFLGLNTLRIYLDARLRNDIRAYVAARGVVESSGPVPAAGAPIPASKSEVEEMKLFFNANKKVFFTAGKQKIKWGSGKFWNPTDFVNARPRDVLYSDDLRSGLNLLKTHVPVGAANLYLVNRFEDARRLDEIGTALRAEIPVGSSEFAISVASIDGRESGGLDVSAAAGPIDVHGEFALIGTSEDFVERWVAGASYEASVFDNDLFGISLEYYRNGLGQSGKASWAFVTDYEAFNFAREYAMLMLYLPTPGSWNHTSFTLFNLFNLSDGSAISKASASFMLMQDLTLTPSFGWHFGPSDGETRVGGQKWDASLAALVKF